MNLDESNYKNINIRKDKILKETIIEELFNAKRHYKRPFTTKEFNKISKKCKHSSVLREFGSWADALLEVNLKR